MLRLLTILAIAAAVAAVACATTEETEPGASPTAPTITVTETVTETATPPTGSTGEDARRTLVVSPQEPQRVSAGSEASFTVIADEDGRPPRLLGFAWTPCDDVDATQPGPLSFVDEDGDGHADHMGDSDTGAARLDTVNGERYENVDDEWPTALHTRDEPPHVRLTMRADDADCATVVVFVDDDSDEEFDVAEDGTPTERYGVGAVTWTD